MNGNWKNITSSPQSLCSWNFPNLKWEKKWELWSSKFFLLFWWRSIQNLRWLKFWKSDPQLQIGGKKLLTNKFSLGFHGAKLGAILWQKDFLQWCMTSQKLSIELKKFQTLLKINIDWVLGIDMIIKLNTNPIIKIWLA